MPPEEQPNNLITPEGVPELADEHRPVIQALRTYKLDAAETIRTRNESLASMALAEQARRQAETQKDIPVKRVRAFRVFLSLMLLVGGGLLVWGIIYIVQTLVSVHQTQIEQVFVHDLLFTEIQKKIVISTEDQNSIEGPFFSELQDQSIPAGNIEGVFYLEERLVPNTRNTHEQDTIDSSTFIKATGLQVPSGLEESLDMPFFIGLYHGKTLSPFLIFKIATNAYPDAFSGMISWEPTMYQDLSQLFQLPPATFPAGNAQFADAVIANKDIRILSTIYGEPVLYYTFFDKETLIIATSQDTLEEIISRLTTPRKISH